MHFMHIYLDGCFNMFSALVSVKHTLILLPESVGNTVKIDKCNDKIFDKNEERKKN